MNFCNRFLAACVLLPISACTTLETTIVDVWQQIRGTRSTVTVEFFHDGMVTALKESHTEGAFGEATQATGNYAFLDEDRVEFDFKIAALLAGSTIMRVAISRDELTLTPTPNGVTTRYRKAH